MGKSYEHDLPGQYRGRGSFCNIGGVYVAMGSGVGRISGVTEGEESDEASDGPGEERRVLGLRVRELDLKFAGQQG